MNSQIQRPLPQIDFRISPNIKWLIVLLAIAIVLVIVESVVSYAFKLDSACSGSMFKFF